MKTLNNFFLFLFFNFLIAGFAYSQTANKFSKKITSYLSKDEVEKAEEFCEEQKNEQDKAECYTLLGNNALEELEYSKAMEYFRKAKNTEKQYNTLLKAIESGNQELINNFLIRTAKENSSSNSENEIAHQAFLPIAEICYKKDDYKNAGDYYQKAGVKQLSIECKVLHAINSKDYIAVVELSEKETIALRNTMQVYKYAADQYFAKGDYINASKYYTKTGDKDKAKLCFTRGREYELKKSLATVFANKFEFSENPLNISKKLDALNKEGCNLEQIAKGFEQNGYKTEADSWYSFSKLLKLIVKESYSGTLLINSTNKDLGNGTSLLSDAWLQINEIANKKKVNLSIQDQKGLETIAKKIKLLKEDYAQKTQNLASKQLEKCGITNVKIVYQVPNAIESAKKLIDDYFISIDTKETPQNTSWLLLGIVKEMRSKIIYKLEELTNSSKSASTQDKIAEEKTAFEKYYQNKIKGTIYYDDKFATKEWNNYLFNKMLQEHFN